MSEITGLARIVPSEKRPLPPGWWREVATPILEQCDTLAALDEQERVLRTWVAWVEKLDDGTTRLELERARRIVDRRRGELLGPPIEGRPPKNFPTVGSLSHSARHRCRRIAQAWLLIVDMLDRATTPREITRKAILDRIAPPLPRKPMPTHQPDRSRAAVRARRDRIRELAAEGASVPQIARAVGITEEGCRAIIARERIEVPADRVMRGTRRISSARILEQTVIDAEGAMADVDLVDLSEIDAATLSDYCERLKAARADLAKFISRLERSVGYVQRSDDDDPRAIGPAIENL